MQTTNLNGIVALMQSMRVFDYATEFKGQQGSHNKEHITQLFFNTLKAFSKPSEAITSFPQQELGYLAEVTNPNFYGKLITPNNLSTNQKAEGLICKNNSIDTPSGLFQYLGVDEV